MDPREEERMIPENATRGEREAINYHNHRLREAKNAFQDRQYRRNHHPVAPKHAERNHRLWC